MFGGELAEAIRRAAQGEIERDDDGTLRRRYVFGPDFPAFAGHFPGAPVLPAVVQIMAAHELLETATGLRLAPAAIDRAKFTQPVTPGAPVEIACRRRAGTAVEAWDVRILSGGKPAASFHLTVRPPAEGG